MREATARRVIRAMDILNGACEWGLVLFTALVIVAIYTGHLEIHW